MPLALGIALVACKSTPDATSVSFSAATYSYQEGNESAYLQLRSANTPYYYPIKVNVSVTMTAGKDASGNELKLSDVITFVETDKPYTVTVTGDRTATITGAEVTYANYDKILFKTKDNDYLQNETVKITFAIISVEGSEIGSTKQTVLTIVDDEYAPKIKPGYYKTDYTPLAGAISATKGQFYLRLQKTDKYKYVASGWFGLSRPRLVGVFDPAACTLTFDGTDYEHLALENPVNAFQNDTIWWYDHEMTKVLKFHGSGVSGLEPIVIKTENIAENTSGVIVDCSSLCGFDIYDYSSATGLGAKYGVWDGFNTAEFTFSKTNYTKAPAAAKSASTTGPIPFNNWTLKEIK